MGDNAGFFFSIYINLCCFRVELIKGEFLCVFNFEIFVIVIIDKMSICMMFRWLI